MSNVHLELKLECCTLNLEELHKYISLLNILGYSLL